MFIHETEQTPLFLFEESHGVIFMKGKSSTVHSKHFYEPILKHLEKFVNDKPLDIKVIMDLDYFNTSSSKYILEILKILKKLFKKGFSVRVDWYYEVDDEDMLEAARDYDDILSEIPFKIIVKK